MPRNLGTVQSYGPILPSLPTSGNFQGRTCVIGSAPYIYVGAGWMYYAPGSPSIATGGTVHTVGTDTVHVFAGSGTLEVEGDLAVEVLVVAGGGGGASGGGGAGGLVHLPARALTGGSYPIVVGAGGTGGTVDSGPDATAGGNSSALDITAVGGGQGGQAAQPAVGGQGGSGGGAPADGGANRYGGAGTSGQGNKGGDKVGYLANPYPCAGGGGAGEPGHGPASTTVSGGGGDGLSFDIAGTAVYYAGGGGGGPYVYSSPGAGGQGGGGGGGVAGTPTTGGGGGGGTSSGNGFAGGSGVVIVRHPTPSAQGMGGGGPRIVAGIINANATVNAGTGFTVSRTSGAPAAAGFYTVSFTVPFAGKTAVNATWNGDGLKSNVGVFLAPAGFQPATGTGFTVSVVDNTANAYYDGMVSFTAVSV